MSVQVMSLVWQADFGTPARKLIAMRLADFSNDDGDNIFPTVGRIATDCGVDRSTVQRILRAFMVEGLLHVIEPGGQNGKGATHYRLDVKRLESLTGGRTMPQGGPREAARGAATASPGGPREAAHNHQEQPPIESRSPQTPQGGLPDDLAARVWKLPTGELVLSEAERSDWLPAFGGDPENLRLALVEIEGEVRPHGCHSLLVQVRRQLARMARFRRDSNQRYAAAVKTNAAHRPPDGAAVSKAIFDRVLGRVPA